MDGIDREINKILLQSMEVNRAEARARRDQRDHDSRVNRLVDDLSDRVNFRFPIRSREQTPQLSDAAYRAYQIEQIKNRSALLHILTLKIMARAVDREDEKADEDFDKIFLRNGF